MSLGDLDGLAASFVNQIFPDNSAACASKKANLAVVAVSEPPTKQAQLFAWVGAIKPLSLGHGSLLSQHEVHRPATPDMRPRRSAVGQHVAVVTTDFFQGVRKDGQAVEGSVVVDGLRRGDHLGREPGVVEDDGAEWVAEDVTEYFTETWIFGRPSWGEPEHYLKYSAPGRSPRWRQGWFQRQLHSGTKRSFHIQFSQLPICVALPQISRVFLVDG